MFFWEFSGRNEVRFRKDLLVFLERGGELRSFVFILVLCIL